MFEDQNQRKSRSELKIIVEASDNGAEYICEADNAASTTSLTNSSHLNVYCKCTIPFLRKKNSIEKSHFE